MNQKEVEIVGGVIKRIEKMFDDETAAIIATRRKVDQTALTRRDDLSMIMRDLRGLIPENGAGAKKE